MCTHQVSIYVGKGVMFVFESCILTIHRDQIVIVIYRRQVVEVISGCIDTCLCQLMCSYPVAAHFKATESVKMVGDLLW